MATYKLRTTSTIRKYLWSTVGMYEVSFHNNRRHDERRETRETLRDEARSFHNGEKTSPLKVSYSFDSSIMSKPKKIINDSKDAVDEFIAGLLLQFPNRLKKLANHHVILTANPSDCVQLLSGGGSGHEPSHAGWIGDGMLSGAICGGIFGE